MNLRYYLIFFGALFLFFGLSGSIFGLGFHMLPFGLGFLLLVIGLCMKNTPKEITTYD